MMRRIAVFFIAILGVFAFLAPASAQQAEDIGNHLVHYSAMSTRMVPPEVARAYGIERSGNRAMINIAVLQKADSGDAMDTPVHASVDASAVNLTGQPRNIELQEIVEDDAIYYIGTFRITNEETLTFNIEVRPEGSDQPADTFSFQQQFYVEE